MKNRPRKNLPVLKKLGHGKVITQINGNNYVFISAGHPWNECACYLSNSVGEPIEEEPIVFRVCADPQILAQELVEILKEKDR